jgi:hypothetical protein
MCTLILIYISVVIQILVSLKIDNLTIASGEIS